ncbi:MAG: hypothetical protein JO171_16940 [Paludibacterium sp.]|uniref:hypothetical protein n=1 Tax=Paludibacterium sp. TaxID=1917523 RepID=UPI0025D8949C|nr:hypothetical protein [Paludibacterium sp.]MBV8048837.1 hypothetical protein [Paludibacterium sp.]MBV8646506.1 hypothetical protein [Paludibacterium sp.]
MMNSTTPISSSLALQSDLRDIQRNLNVLIRQLDRPGERYSSATTAMLMAAMGQKLTLLSHALND